MIIDAHAHPVGKRENWDAFLAECRANGVARTVVSALGAEGWLRDPALEETQAANDAACAFAEYGGNLIDWIAYLNPQVEGSVAELDRCLALGAVGVKLWVSIKSRDGSLDRTVELVRAAGDRNVPVLIHTFDRADPDPSSPYAITSVEFAEIARRAPGTVLIGAHAGGNWRRGLGFLRDLPNALVDISGCHPERGEVEILLPDLGRERILFGSDMYGRRLSAQLAKVVFADVNEEDREFILWRNAARVFRLRDLDETMRPEGVRAWEGAPPDPAEEHFVFCGDWPWSPCGGLEPTDLNCALERCGIHAAWVGDLAGVFRFDLAAANRDFRKAADGCSHIHPLAAAAPSAPNWLYVLEQARGGFDGVIVYPYLHGWRLDDPDLRPFFVACGEMGMGMWVNLTVGDHRFRPPGVGWRPVAPGEIAAFLASAPANRYVFQAADFAQAGVLADGPLPAGTSVRIEVSRLSDFTGQFEKMAARAGRERLVFGSEFPLRDLRTVRYALGAPMGRRGS